MSSPGEVHEDRVLVVVSTSLQALNAAEYLSAERASAWLVSLEGRKRTHTGNDHLRQTLEYLGWRPDLVIRSYRGRPALRRRLGEYLAGLRLMSMSRRAARVVVGNTATRPARMAANFSGAPCVLVDDGLAVLTASRRRAELSGRRPWRKAGLGRMLAGESSRSLVRPVEFFTSYEPTLVAGDRVSPNALHHVGALLRSGNAAPDHAGAVFLGQPLAEHGLLSESAYRSYLRAVAASAPGPWAYLPHRAENRKLIAGRALSAGMELHRVGLPIELAIASGRIRPTTLAAAFSSALVSCALLFPDRVGQCVQVDCRPYLVKDQERVAMANRAISDALMKLGQPVGPPPSAPPAGGVR